MGSRAELDKFLNSFELSKNFENFKNYEIMTLKNIDQEEMIISYRNISFFKASNFPPFVQHQG